MKDIKNIELIFENCDSIAFNPEHLENIIMDDFKTRVHRCACNAIYKFDCANIIFIYIFKRANQTYQEFRMDGFNRLMFDRITSANDITGIKLTYGLEDEEEISVDWEDGSNEYENKNQISRITNRGDLKILICSPDNPRYKEFKELFDNDEDPEEIKSEEEMFR